MNETTANTGTSYWFTEHGEWGTVPVEHIYFGPEHHANIHEAFEMVSDWQYPNWAAFLARHPHELDLTTYGSCQACEDLVEVFNR
jgi:hypothetical protein